MGELTYESVYGPITPFLFPIELHRELLMQIITHRREAY